jgi:hypothetical protein
MSVTESTDESGRAGRIRPEIVDDVVWVLDHACDDLEVTGLVLELIGVSQAELDAAFALARTRPAVSLGGDVEALRAKIARLIL